ncbi:hypothetical protein TB2_020990 [Malus domestica]
MLLGSSRKDLLSPLLAKSAQIITIPPSITPFWSFLNLENSDSSHTSIFSPLVLVTQANDVEASKKLIEGADVDLNEQDEKGYSAAMISAEGGYLESFKLLINAGADINLQNKRGQTVLDSPVEFYGTLHQAVQHSATDFVHTLRSRGSDVLLMPMDTLR